MKKCLSDFAKASASEEVQEQGGFLKTSQKRSE